MRSQFLSLGGLHANAIEEARKALAATNDDARSTHHLNLAVVLDHSGDANGALEEIRKGLAATFADDPFGEVALRLLFVAAALFDSIDPLRSLAATEAAEAVLDVVRLRTGDAMDRIAFDDAERHRQVAATLVQRRLAAGDVLGALATADRHRARSLAQVLPLKGREQPEAGAAVNEPPASDASLDDQIAYATVVARTTLAGEGAPALDGATLADVVANAGRTVVLFHPSGESLIVFVIRPGREVVVATATLATSVSDIVALTNALRAQLGIVVSARAARGEMPAPSFEDLALAFADDDASAAADVELERLRRSLHDALFLPLLPMLKPGEPLTVVPYRELAVIPLSILTDSCANSLVDRHALSVLPSLASLGSLRSPGAGPAHAVVVGDPEVSPGLGLSPLPGAAAEAKRVAQALRASGVDTTLLLRQGATEAAFRKYASGARLVHLACHATVSQRALASPLFLTPAPPEDGLLLPGEIADLRLDGALVVLAACQSGLGRATADGVLGLGRAFLQAGARTVMLSLWRVSDSATSHLMQAFYDALRGEAPGAHGGLDVAAAARYAQLATREAISDHPSAWGPWLIVGDGGWCLG